MRITNGMIRNSSLNSLYDNMGRLNTLFDQMNTLKKIQRPSDDPIIAGRSLKLRLNVMESEQHKNNVDEAKAWMDVTETALSNMTNIIKDIRTRANQAANGTLTPEDKEKVVNDIEQLYKQLEQESNVTYAGRYVFSGFKTDQEVILGKDAAMKQDVILSGETTLSHDLTIPAGTEITKPILDKDGNVLVAAGPVGADTVLPAGTVLPKDTVLPKGTQMPAGMVNLEVLNSVGDQNIHYEIGVNNTIDVNTTGVPGFMQGMREDIMAMLDQIKGSMAEPPTVTEEQLGQFFTEMIGKMDGHLKTVSSMEADLGSRQNRLEYTEARLADDKTNLTALLTKTEDVDIEEVYTEFNTQYMVYQSALQATSKVVMNTLADFLR
ncbi:MAG: flagellar hook-associated protein FlgL [Cellulosilyticaceae bacterium]